MDRTCLVTWLATWEWQPVGVMGVVTGTVLGRVSPAGAGGTGAAGGAGGPWRAVIVATALAEAATC